MLALYVAWPGVLSRCFVHAQTPLQARCLLNSKLRRFCTSLAVGLRSPLCTGCERAAVPASVVLVPTSTQPIGHHDSSSAFRFTFLCLLLPLGALLLIGRCCSSLTLPWHLLLHLASTADGNRSVSQVEGAADNTQHQLFWNKSPVWGMDVLPCRRLPVGVRPDWATSQGQCRTWPRDWCTTFIFPCLQGECAPRRCHRNLRPKPFCVPPPPPPRRRQASQRSSFNHLVWWLPPRHSWCSRRVCGLSGQCGSGASTYICKGCHTRRQLPTCTPGCNIRRRSPFALLLPLLCPCAPIQSHLWKRSEKLCMLISIRFCMPPTPPRQCLVVRSLTVDMTASSTPALPCASTFHPSRHFSRLGAAAKHNGSVHLIHNLFPSWGIGQHRHSLQLVLCPLHLPGCCGLHGAPHGPSLKSTYRTRSAVLLCYCVIPRGWDLYVVLRLPIGVRSSIIFNQFAEALLWIAVHVLCNLLHYLDDYFLVCAILGGCTHGLRTSQLLCGDLLVILVPRKLVLWHHPRLGSPGNNCLYVRAGLSAPSRIYSPSASGQDILVAVDWPVHDSGRIAPPFALRTGRQRHCLVGAFSPSPPVSWQLNGMDVFLYICNMAPKW